MAYGNKPMVQQKKFSAMISTNGYKNMIANTLRDPDRQKRFIAAITSAVAATPALQNCEPSSILAGALLGEGLNLSPSPQLGQYYLVPFNVKAKDKDGNTIKNEKNEDMYVSKAQFVLGYKGYVQLALRSGQYRKIVVRPIKYGEIEYFDSFEEELVGRRALSFEESEKAPVIGYVAYFEYLNGFRKTIYWSKEQMLAHADKYSPAFSAQAMKKIEAGQIPERDMWRYSSFWYKDFDGMACKTMLRQLISKWGIMSTEMQTALNNDEQFADISNGTGGDPVYVEEVSDMDIQSPEEMDAPASNVPMNAAPRSKATPNQIDLSQL